MLFVEDFPDSAETDATAWEITKDDHIDTWLEAGINDLYFIYGDPERPIRLLSGGLFGLLLHHLIPG